MSNGVNYSESLKSFPVVLNMKNAMIHLGLPTTIPTKFLWPKLKGSSMYIWVAPFSVSNELKISRKFERSSERYLEILRCTKLHPSCEPAFVNSRSKEDAALVRAVFNTSKIESHTNY